jgi:hypothetical protein
LFFKNTADFILPKKINKHEFIEEKAAHLSVEYQQKYASFYDYLLFIKTQLSKFNH